MLARDRPREVGPSTKRSGHHCDGCITSTDHDQGGRAALRQDVAHHKQGPHMAQRKGRLMLQVVNVDALSRAADAIVGPEVSKLIAGLYQIIDRAMKDGYELGKYEAEQNVEAALDVAFDNGFEFGHVEGLIEGHGDGQS